MRKNNKGFMLIEVIITSTIVITTMVTLYTSFNKLYNNYRTKNSYYNIDAVYATRDIINLMLNNDYNLSEFIYNTFPNNTYGFIIKKGICYLGDESTETTRCSDRQKYYKIQNMILSEYDSESLNNLKNTSSAQLNQTFKDYIDYLITYYDIKQTEEYSYIILTEIQDGDNYYYANLRMRWHK